MMKFYCDMNLEINLDIKNLTFPCSHENIINQSEEHLGQWNEINPTEGDDQPTPKGKKEDGRVRLVVVDSIASNPGYVHPYYLEGGDGDGQGLMIGRYFPGRRLWGFVGSMGY
jgi:hypothetical protein